MTAVRAKSYCAATDPGKKSGILLTARDVEILQFVNTFGFCEMPQLMAQFGWTKARSYQILKRLIDAGLLVYQRIFHGRPGIYRVSPRGAGHTDFPALRQINFNNYNHSLAITDVHLHLRKKHPQAEWLSERELIQQKYAGGLGKSGHLPDGILLLAGKEDEKIAIEVELRSKAKARLENIIKWYTAQFEFTEVWYFCPENVAKTVKGALSENHSKFIKVFSLREIMS